MRVKLDASLRMIKEFYSLGSELWCLRIITSGELSLMKPIVLNSPFIRAVPKCIKISSKAFGGLASSEKSLDISPSAMFAKELKPNISNRPVPFSPYLFHHGSGKKLERILSLGYPCLLKGMILYG